MFWITLYLKGNVQHNTKFSIVIRKAKAVVRKKYIKYDTKKLDVYKNLHKVKYTH